MKHKAIMPHVGVSGCAHCEGRGFEWRVPNGFNPFSAGGFNTARAMSKVPCRNGCPFPTDIANVEAAKK